MPFTAHGAKFDDAARAGPVILIEPVLPMALTSKEADALDAGDPGGALPFQHDMRTPLAGDPLRADGVGGALAVGGADATAVVALDAEGFTAGFFDPVASVVGAVVDASAIGSEAATVGALDGVAAGAAGAVVVVAAPVVAAVVVVEAAVAVGLADAVPAPPPASLRVASHTPPPAIPAIARPPSTRSGAIDRVRAAGGAAATTGAAWAVGLGEALAPPGEAAVAADGAAGAGDPDEACGAGVACGAAEDGAELGP